MGEPGIPSASERELSGLPPWPAVLRALREARGSTREGWATRLGYSPSTVQRWERGTAAPDATAEAAW
jgi:DNA-binding transcriptional regulator YiaG